MTLVLSSLRRTRVKDAASRGTVGEAREETNTQGLVHGRAFPLPVSSEPEGGSGGSQPRPSLCPGSGFFSAIEITSWAQGSRCSSVLVQPSLGAQHGSHARLQGDGGLCVPQRTPHGERHRLHPHGPVCGEMPCRQSLPVFPGWLQSWFVKVLQ